MNVALIFPGQGAQKQGMGQELYQGSPEAKAIFDEAERVCGNGLLQVMFEGPEEKLTQTSFAQPAILTMSIAGLRAFEASPKFKNLSVKFAAGLSLGEYSALAASKTLSFADTLKLVLKRGQLMDEACAKNAGAMAAVLGFDKTQLLKICEETGVEVANFNSNEQIVITGHTAKVNAAVEVIKAAGGKVIPLSVAGAFHSSLMQSAADQFQLALKDVAIHPTDVKVVTNVNGQAQLDNETIRQNLAKQITSSVQWVDSIHFMAAQGVSDFVEIGPGKVLKGLIRRINPALRVYNIEKPEDIQSLDIGR